ncbi:MAG TPA: hypothetical protein DHW20_05415, partial [Gemmatimonadetes bacterium]|nr:hypothetical protein [Gemmatimonadota bacterium]
MTFAKCYLTIRIDVRFLDFYGLTPVATSVISTSSRPMKAITFQGIQSLAYEDIPDPGLLDSTDAIIRVTAAGICGSDLHPYFGREQGLDVGTVMGHELLGEVVEVGSDVRNFSIGDIGVAPFTTNCGSCFFCRSGLTARCETGQLFGWIENGLGLHGTQAEFVRVPMADSTLVVVPDGLDEGVALLAGDILSTAAFGAELAGVQTGDLVVVVGCGPVGLLSIRAAREKGAHQVVAVDSVVSRLKLARRFGAIPVNFKTEEAFEVVMACSEGRGADCAIEAVGSPEATRTAAELLRFGGS